jgi:hypothetical protein
MVQITVDAHVARQIYESVGPITLIDPQGQTLGSLERPIFSPDEVQAGLNRLADPDGWLTSDEVLDHLRKLGANPCGSQ